MTRHRWFSWAALGCALVLTLPAAAAPVPGEQDKPLAQVPAKSAIVVQLKGFERTQERLHALIKNAMPDFADLAKEKMKEAIDQALMGRKLEAIPKDGHIFLVVTDLASLNGPTPKMAILVPVTDYKKFRDGLLKDDERKEIKTDPLGYENANVDGQATYFVNRKNGYAVVTPDADVAASFVKKYDGLDGKLSKPLAQRLMDADVSVYVDMVAVNKEHGDAIKMAQGQLEQALEGSPDKSATEMIKRIYAPIFQAVSDSTALLVSADLRPDGVLLHTEVEVPADSKSNTLLKGWKALPTTDLAKMPGGSMTYTSMAYTPELMKTLGSLSYGFTDPDSKEGKAIKNLMDELAAAGPRSQISAGNIPASGLVVTKFDNPAKAVDAQLKLFKELKAGSMYGTVLKSDPVVKENAMKHGGFEFNSVSLKWDLEKTIEKQAAAAGMNDDQKKAMVEYMKSIVGEGTDVWFGTDGKTMMQVTAKDWESARDLLDRYQKGEQTLGSSQAYKDTIKNLTAENSMVMLVDVPQMTEVMVKAVVTVLQASGLPIPIPPGIEKPAVKAKTSFLGLGLTLASGRGSFDLWLSATSINDVYKMYVEKLLKPNF
jgi:hypothetical protein